MESYFDSHIVFMLRTRTVLVVKKKNKFCTKLIGVISNRNTTFRKIPNCTFASQILEETWGKKNTFLPPTFIQ
jgi:hypothetical protein